MRAISKKIISVILLLILMLPALVACGNDDGVPKGMKLASNRTRVDYSFFVPKEWVIDEMSDFSRAHSDNETTSISVFTFDCDSEITINDWWQNEYLPKITPTLKEYKFVEQTDKVVVDKKSASAYVFVTSRDEGSLNKHRVTITKNDSKMYVIWYTSLVTSDTDYYLENLGTLSTILSVFRFTPITQDSAPLKPFEDENAPEGMMLISDKSIVLYSLYVPSTWIIDEQSAMTMAHVSEQNKSSVSVMQWNMTKDTTTIDKWWQDYHKAELQSTFGERLVIDSEGTEVKLGEAEAKAYEYHIWLSGMTYKYYVVASIDQGSIHVLTYTSTEELYDDEIDTVKEQILPNFSFN
ncbi:MAG: hypothetical protein IKA43_04940 [Clostridia bacterium]|nr:hypothetical protein [Clostridia bacterium]